MKIRILLATLLCALAAAPGLRAQEPKAAAEKDPQTQLGAAMEKMNDAFKIIRKNIADSTKNQETLAAVAELRKHAEEALKFEPANKAKVPVADQPKFVADYQAKMKATIADIVKLEDTLKAGNNEEAGKVFAEIGKMQKEGHTEFRKKKQ